ncbi:MAG: hypothetical protein ABIR56_17040 [Polaromonas sp.]
MAKYVPFLSVEDGDDLIVSFALGEHASTSLTLLRTPKYEFILPEEERGVCVDSGSDGSDESELLVAVHWGSEFVSLKSTRREYQLDIRAVEADEIVEAKAVLAKMNFDKRFQVTHA